MSTTKQANVMSAAKNAIGSPLQGVRCDLCGSSRDQTFITLPDLLQRTSDHNYRIARCRDCDLIYLNPRPYVWDLSRYYPESYSPFKRSSLGTSARAWLHQRSVRELQHLLRSPRRIVDLGCGTGELLQQVRRAGNVNVEGVEPSTPATQVARYERGLIVHNYTLEQVGYPDESVDTVLLSHVLEHLPSPKKTLQEIDRILRPGGAVVIWVPNARSLPARALGRYWMGWDVPRHLYDFTSGSLHKLIATTSLQPGEILHERHAIEWSWGIRLWATERFQSEAVDRALAGIHPALALALTPLGVLSAWFRMSGRIRIIAWKPMR
jgi:SAM-dependent methyltransferase